MSPFYLPPLTSQSTSERFYHVKSVHCKTTQETSSFGAGSVPVLRPSVAAGGSAFHFRRDAATVFSSRAAANAHALVAGSVKLWSWRHWPVAGGFAIGAPALRQGGTRGSNCTASACCRSSNATMMRATGSCEPFRHWHSKNKKICFFTILFRRHANLCTAGESSESEMQSGCTGRGRDTAPAGQ